MKTRPLGKTGLQLPCLSFGASSLGQEFRTVDVNEALRSVRVALDLGMNFIDTSPFYGRGMSECLLGVALRGIPRDSYLLGTKLGRYDRDHFDFSPRRVVESVDVSLHRLGVEYLDILLCHDIEFVNVDRVIEETLPALRAIQQAGKARFIGVSGYPMAMFRRVIERADVDVILSYNHATLQNTMLLDLVPDLQARRIGIMNAAPFSARLLTDAPLPDWHKATPFVRATVRQAADLCRARGSEIAKLALQYSLGFEAMATCVVGSANPSNIAQWAEWADEGIDQSLLNDVLAILTPIHNWHYTEGRPENNDTPSEPGI